jgi:hypothetical protein
VRWRWGQRRGIAVSRRKGEIESQRAEEGEQEGLLNRLFRRERPPTSQPQPADDARLYPTPAVEYAFRSIARNPSRYRQALVELYLAEPDERPGWITTWFCQAFQAAWDDVRAQHAGLHAQLPRRLSSEESFLMAVARRWGDLLFSWTAQLYLRSDSFRHAVGQARSRVEVAPRAEPSRKPGEALDGPGTQEHHGICKETP